MNPFPGAIIYPTHPFIPGSGSMGQKPPQPQRMPGPPGPPGPPGMLGPAGMNGRDGKDGILPPHHMELFIRVVMDHAFLIDEKVREYLERFSRLSPSLVNIVLSFTNEKQGHEALLGEAKATKEETTHVRHRVGRRYDPMYDF